MDLREPEDVTFHYGLAFTAADVAYTFERILDPFSQSTLTSSLGLIARVKTLNEHRVVFQLHQSQASIPLLLGHRSAAIIPAGSGETISFISIDALIVRVVYLKGTG